jgi:hypothetical protein
VNCKFDTPSSFQDILNNHTFSVRKCVRRNAREEMLTTAQAKSWSAWSGPRDSEIFPHRESPHNASCSAIGHDPVSLYVQPVVVYCYLKRSFPCSPGSYLFSGTEKYNYLSLIQVNTFLKTVLKYLAQLLSCMACGRTQCTHQFFRHKFPRFVRRVTVVIQS